MQTQVQQAIQQTFSGLALGTPVWVNEYTEQFMKNNASVVLTPTKHIDQDPYFTANDWGAEEEDWQTIQLQTSQPQEAPAATGHNAKRTTPKTIDQPVLSHGGA